MNNTLSWEKQCRVWVGPEMEGPDEERGVRTMFVQGEKLDLSRVSDFLANYNDCSTKKDRIEKIYLGAGRTDLHFFIGVRHIAKYCRDNGVVLCVETSYTNLHTALEIRRLAEDYAEVKVIVRFDDSRLVDCTIKLDDHETVAIVTGLAVTNLKTLNESEFRTTFEDDVEIKPFGIMFNEIGR